MTINAADVSGGTNGIDARNSGSGALTITSSGDVTGTAGGGIFADSVAGGPINLNVGAASTVTSDAAAGFAINVSAGPGDVTLAGALNGGGGGALQFDQAIALDDRLELYAPNRRP